MMVLAFVMVKVLSRTLERAVATDPAVSDSGQIFRPPDITIIAMIIRVNIMNAGHRITIV